MKRSAPMDPGARAGRPSGEDGMTLIEVLIVLAIMAVAAAVVVLSIGNDHGMAGLAEAKRIAGRVQFASDRSLTGEGPMALVVAGDGYSFLQWDEAARRWSPATEPALESAALPAGMSLAASGAEGPLVLGADSGGQPFVLTLSSEERNWNVAFDGMTARTAPAQAGPAT